MQIIDCHTAAILQDGRLLCICIHLVYLCLQTFSEGSWNRDISISSANTRFLAHADRRYIRRLSTSTQDECQCSGQSCHQCDVTDVTIQPD
ncbi:hypothetical protein DPMN_034317 [Dreissena polymorpha]|uniref:Uncharacterized protein n=1 Tax=Dreissena polymorpha TaxID=45954 RepID=A0A9D4RKT7_DREPO|nr:hypothetical protein DPMN_034317 [Dreissena polymorpha]